jgi:AcrR family transcriptional regulator
MDTDKEKILKFSQEYFLHNGFYKTSMDEIASSLRMSKKTIYKYFSSKDDLLKETIFNFIELHAGNIKIIVEADDDAVYKFFRMTEYLANLIQNFKDKFISDIQNYAPGLWKEIDNFRTRMMTKNLNIIIQQGKNEGVFADHPSEIIVTVFISSIRGIVNPDFIMNNRFSVKSALEATIDILMNGIMTEKGKKIFRKIKSGAGK